MEENIPTSSPTPDVIEGEVIKKEATLTFPEAMKEVINGKKISKNEWGNSDIYGLLKDGFLMLRKDDGEFYQWIINDGDLNGDDYFVLSETN